VSYNNIYKKLDFRGHSVIIIIMKTIDITPTWSALIIPMVEVLKNPKADAQAKRDITHELSRLAKIVDAYNKEASKSPTNFENHNKKKSKRELPEKVDSDSIDNLVSSKELRDIFKVTHRTIKRWEERYGWKPFYINQRLLRYRKDEVQKSRGVKF
jgi:hypothetical protein